MGHLSACVPARTVLTKLQSLQVAVDKQLLGNGAGEVVAAELEILQLRRVAYTGRDGTRQLVVEQHQVSQWRLWRQHIRDGAGEVVSPCNDTRWHPVSVTSSKGYHSCSHSCF